jgi:hypothetical protein
VLSSNGEKIYKIFGYTCHSCRGLWYKLEVFFETIFPLTYRSTVFQALALNLPLDQQLVSGEWFRVSNGVVRTTALYKKVLRVFYVCTFSLGPFSKWGFLIFLGPKRTFARRLNVCMYCMYVCIVCMYGVK